MAAIIVGTVSLTGIGPVMTEIVELLSGGNLMLVLVAVILILDTGQPTTANYIVVSTLMAPVIVELGALAGLVVPLIVVNRVVCYYGLMADITPAVGLASFAAAAIARSDPIKTGITAFDYSMRTAILPFLFIFNAQLLLIGFDNWFHLLRMISIAIIAMLVFAAATQGYFLVRSRWYESVALLLVTFALFRPGFFWDELYAPHVDVPSSEFMKLVEAAPAGASKRVWIEGQNMDGKVVCQGVMLPLGDVGPARERLRKLGLTVVPMGNEMQIAQVQFGSKADKLGVEQGFRIATIEMPADLARAGALHAEMARRLLTLADYAVATGAQGLLFTCSAFGPCIDVVARHHPSLPVIKPNEVMIEDAMAAVVGGGCIGLVASLAPTLVSMPAEFPAAALLRTALAEDALTALDAGDGEKHDVLCVEAAARLAEQACTVIALAQLSLARAKMAVRQRTGLPVLSTVDSAVMRLLQRMS